MKRRVHRGEAHSSHVTERYFRKRQEEYNGLCYRNANSIYLKERSYLFFSEYLLNGAPFDGEAAYCLSHHSELDSIRLHIQPVELVEVRTECTSTY